MCYWINIRSCLIISLILILTNGVTLWMSSNRLQLNAEKTEFMWCVPPRRRHHLPTDQLIVQSTSVAPVTSVRDLGVHLDSDMSMHMHVTQLVCSCYGCHIQRWARPARCK